MATGRYFTQTDFRQFNLNFPWAERTGVALQTTGLILMNAVQYDALYQVNYDLPGAATGAVNLYGTEFARNAAGHLTTGLVMALTADFISGGVTTRQSRVEGVYVNAGQIDAAMRSVTMLDDQQVLRAMFRINDVITLSPSDDYAFSYTGSDTLYGEGGNDQLLGQAGNDVLVGGSGRDTLTGGAGADRLFGGYDADVLRGNSGDDFLKGEGGADVFEFRVGDGADTINDWDDGVDRIRLYGVTASNQISIVALTGGDVQITALNFSIVVLNAAVEDFQLVRGTGLYALI